MTPQEGGCLCGRVRHAVRAAPLRVTVCHCRFCQRATGSAYMVEPIFDAADHVVLTGAPKTHDHVSAGSGKVVHLHFCGDCGTSLWLSFELFAGVVGVYAGTFDDPAWFPMPPDTTKHIFLSSARPDTVIPAGLPTFSEHAMTTDGTPLRPVIHAAPHTVGGG